MCLRPIQLKNVGSYFENEEARNRDLMRAFNAQLAIKKNRSMSDVYKATVNSPSERFWVSEERAAIVISNMMRGDTLEGMGRTKRTMYYEIFHRVRKLRKLRPSDSIYNLTFEVVNSPAPQFYLTPGSAKVIIYKIRKQWYEQRKRKFRHLFM